MNCSEASHNASAVRAVLLMWFLICPAWRAQSVPHYQKDFPPEEFKARWEKVFAGIGDRAVAIVQGMPQVNGYIFPRQNNEFYYLCGVDTPHSYLVLDGRSRKVTLFLPPRNARLEAAEGRILSADDADLAKQLVGVDEVASTESMSGEWMRNLLRESAPGNLLRGTGPVLYTPFAPAEGYAQSRGELQNASAAIASDYWDGRPSREAHFIGLLRSRFPRAEMGDLTPILDGARGIKSAREIALIRRASQLAGLGLMEAMKSTRPGVFEYQLEAAARYVFQVNGARLDGYRAIVASGTSNIWNMHYYRNNAALKDSDLVLMDYAPDFGCYVSDIGRMWPVNGKFSPWQRELLQFVLEYRNAILKRIRPGVTTKQIMDEAKEAMEPVFARTKFSKPEYERGARNLVERGGGVFSHTVGMAVHDVGGYSRDALKPGQVFSVDPQLRMPDEKLYLRYEDVVVVTETGVENFTDFLPSELDDIEKLVGQGGVVQKFPPVSEEELKRRSAGVQSAVSPISNRQDEDARTRQRAPESPRPSDATPSPLNGERAGVRGERLSLANLSHEQPLQSAQLKILPIDPPEKDFFSKRLDFHGIPIKAHNVVADEALHAAWDRLSLMFTNLLTRQPMVISNLVAAGAALHIIGRDQVTTDLPEWRHDKGVPRPEYNGLTRDQRTRGMGGRLTSCGEENLLKLEKDRYRGRDICLHEFAHNVRNNGIQREVRARFDEQHKRSLAKGLWLKSYAGSSPDEFFAELTMWYFGTHGDLRMTGPKPEDGPEGLRKYDPEAYALMDDFYGGRIEITKAEPRGRGRRADADQPDSSQPAPGSTATTNNAPLNNSGVRNAH